MVETSENEIKLKQILQIVNDSEISSIKGIVSALIRIINDPKSTINELNDVIKTDPPLTARVLRLANSAFYAPPKQIDEIIQSVIWVGYEAIKELALSQKVCKLFKDDEPIDGYSRTDLWRHSLAIAIMGKMIYRREFGEKGDNMYAMGLLHDLGLIVIDQFCHSEFIQIIEHTLSSGKDIAKIERQVLGFDHTQLGKAITKDWNLPDKIYMAIGNHHDPSGVPKNYYRSSMTLYVIDTYCIESGFGYLNKHSKDIELYNYCMKKLGFSTNSLDLIIEDVREKISKMEEQGFFN